jgi:hypothetical protein
MISRNDFGPDTADVPPSRRTANFRACASRFSSAAARCRFLLSLWHRSWGVIISLAERGASRTSSCNGETDSPHATVVE